MAVVQFEDQPGRSSVGRDGDEDPGGGITACEHEAVGRLRAYTDAERLRALHLRRFDLRRRRLSRRATLRRDVGGEEERDAEENGQDRSHCPQYSNAGSGARGAGTLDNDWMSYPSRIVCLTEETTETLYLIGEGDRVVGISGYTVRPPEARSKPKVSAFINARFEKIEALKPDLVLAFSDLQADISAELIRRGYPVVTFNQRTVAEILRTIRMIGGLVGAAAKAESLAMELEAGLDAIRRRAAALPRRPRVFFEEWPDPLISGISWVDELVEIAGGAPVFPELRTARLGKERIVSPDAVAARDPEVIVASWCGKGVKKSTIVQRPGWDRVTAVITDQVHEIRSTFILQPGPASLTEGVRQLHDVIARAAAATPSVA
jgi:iron complex transport system substrate-binding protein